MKTTDYHETVASLIERIAPLDPLEASHKKSVLDWIATNTPLCRTEKPATPPKHLVSYASLLDLETKTLLLVDHKKAGLWLPPGGHVEPNEHPKKTACRELEEELGVKLPLLQEDPLFLTATETIGMTAGHVDVSLWYVFLANSSSSFDFDASEFHSIHWFPLNNLPLKRTDPHLSRFCKKLPLVIKPQL